jgi:hypothetical protein
MLTPITQAAKTVVGLWSGFLARRTQFRSLVVSNQDVRPPRLRTASMM